MGSNQQVQYSEFLEEKFKKPKSIKCGYILIVVKVLHGPSGAVVYLSASSLSLLGVLLVVGSIPDLPSLFWHCQVGKDKFRHRLASATCDESRLKSFTFDQSETFLTTSTCPFSLVLVQSRNIGFSLGFMVDAEARNILAGARRTLLADQICLQRSPARSQLQYSNSTGRTLSAAYNIPSLLIDEKRR